MRGKAWRRHKNISKYITRLKKNLYYCLCEDKTLPIRLQHNSWRKPESWRDFKENSHFANLLKNTRTIIVDKGKQIDNHHSIKVERRESKKNIMKQIVESFD